MKEPKDLKIKIGTKKEAEYTRILKVQEESLLNSQINQEISEVIIDLLNKKIAKEKETFK